MAVQSNVLENGEWVTRTVEPRELFRQTSSSHQARPRKQPAAAPEYGILTKTVIESPVFHWVLPAQLRSCRNNDVAMIGDNFVQVSELGPDIQLQAVARKRDFGSRIRNACVIGSSSIVPNQNGQIKSEDDVDMLEDVSGHEDLPPQLLALVLDHGELVFLYLRRNKMGEWDFVSYSEEISDSNLVRPGFHMAVDPSSRYLALACPVGHFQLYELEPMETLHARISDSAPLRPIKWSQPRAVRGVIHKIAFLYPGPGSEELIMLMLFLVHRGTAKIVTYEWDLGDDPQIILREEKSGWRLREECQMPVLIVPSTVRYSFLLVTEVGLAFWASLANGALEVSEVDIGERRSGSDLHIGNHGPLWTAWSRPWRLPEYHIQQDTIYLAREDGILNYVELSTEHGIVASVELATVDCNIDTAFACLYDPFADALITGGDSGPGAIWQAEPRKPPRKFGTIPNWSPTVDFVSTNLGSTASQASSRGPRNRNRPNAGGAQRKRDRIFACSGRGKAASVAELRYGLEATVSEEMDLHSPIRECWIMADPSDRGDGDFYLLIAVLDRSVIIHMKGDFSQATNVDQDQVPYDLASRTLAAQEFDGTNIQVTTSSIAVVTPSESTRHLPHEIDDDHTSTITDAAMRDRVIALSLYSDSRFRVKTITVDGLNITLGPSFDVEGEVTCVALAKFGGQLVLLAGVWKAGIPILMVCPAQMLATDKQPRPTILELSRLCRGLGLGGDGHAASPTVEALTTIVAFDERPEATSLSIGTRSGEVFTLTVDSAKPQEFQGVCDKFGVSAARVLPLSNGVEPPSVLVCCDSELSVLMKFSRDPRLGFEKKFRVFATNTEGSGPPSDFSSVVRIPGHQGRTKLAMASGSWMYISELQYPPKPLLRHFPLSGAPVKIMYCHRLDVLVVAVLEGQRSHLRFLDPETGVDLSLPRHMSGREVSNIAGLEEKGTRILSLSEWNKEKDGMLWSYLVVAVRLADGRGAILLVSADRDESTIPGSSMTPGSAIRKIHFCTRVRRLYDEPVWSVATEQQGLLVCFGSSVRYDVLDHENRRFEVVKQHQLSSPAAWMEVVDGELHVVTVKHSLEILDFKSSPEDKAMARLHSDDNTKNLLHSIQAVDVAEKDKSQPISLLSDIYCGLWGMWVPPRDDEPLRAVFQAELQSSVRKFARARARPYRDSFTRTPKYGCVGSSPDGSDIFGLGIDGSLQHFTILSAEAWRLLRFIQNLTARSPELCVPAASSARVDKMDVEWDPEPQRRPIVNMQVDGDVLQRCLDKKTLAELVSQPEHAARLGELVGAVGDVEAASGEPTDPIALAYEILRYYLAPVL